MTHCDKFIKTKYNVSKRLRKKYPGCSFYLTFEADDRCILYSKQSDTLDIRWAHIQDMIQSDCPYDQLSPMNTFLLNTFFNINIRDDGTCTFIALADREFCIAINKNQPALWDAEKKYKIFNIHIDGQMGIRPSLENIVLNVVKSVNNKSQLSSIKIQQNVPSMLNMSTILQYMTE